MLISNINKACFVLAHLDDAEYQIIESRPGFYEIEVKQLIPYELLEKWKESHEKPIDNFNFFRYKALQKEINNEIKILKEV